MNSNLPPGVMPGGLPGNTPEDAAWEAFMEEIMGDMNHEAMTVEEAREAWKMGFEVWNMQREVE